MQWMLDGYNAPTTFPENITQYANLDDAGITLIDPTINENHEISWIQLHNMDSGTMTVSFRYYSSATEWMRVILLPGTGLTLPGWNTNGNGLEAFTTTVPASNGVFISHTHPNRSS